jgi:hypothetical protein
VTAKGTLILTFSLREKELNARFWSSLGRARLCRAERTSYNPRGSTESRPTRELSVNFFLSLRERTEVRIKGSGYGAERYFAMTMIQVPRTATPT